jgi:hypothetical protein
LLQGEVCAWHGVLGLQPAVQPVPDQERGGCRLLAGFCTVKPPWETRGVGIRSRTRNYLYCVDLGACRPGGKVKTGYQLGALQKGGDSGAHPILGLAWAAPRQGCLLLACVCLFPVCAHLGPERSKMRPRLRSDCPRRKPWRRWRRDGRTFAFLRRHWSTVDVRPYGARVEATAVERWAPSLSSC